MNLECAGITIDLRRQSDAVLSYVPPHLSQLFSSAEKWIAGEPINESEHRAAMHMALRAKDNSLFPSSYTEPVLRERARQKTYVEECKTKDFIHVGVGGSILGPQFVVEALRASHEPQKKVIFLSSLSPTEIKRAVHSVDSNNSLCLIGSKTFTTSETKYITERLTGTFGWSNDRFIALTASPATAQLGNIPHDRIFPFWEWVGGRYSVWSSIGLPIALTYGWDVFEEFLAGAREVDRVTCTDVASSPALALAKLLHAKRHMCETVGLPILPYHADLKSFPAYLQQLIMESNGKPAPHDRTAPIVFGATGTEFQHSFGQFLQQGPDICLSLFLTVTPPAGAPQWEQDAQRILNTNAIAQADTLWHGRPGKNVSQTIEGGRPSIVMNLPDMSAYTIGALLALMEYVTVFDGFLSGINPFDQWGVEAAKSLARERLENGS